MSMEMWPVGMGTTNHRPAQDKEATGLSGPDVSESQFMELYAH